MEQGTAQRRNRSNRNTLRPTTDRTISDDPNRSVSPGSSIVNSAQSRDVLLSSNGNSLWVQDGDSPRQSSGLEERQADQPYRLGLWLGSLAMLFGSLSGGVLVGGAVESTAAGLITVLLFAVQSFWTLIRLAGLFEAW